MVPYHLALQALEEDDAKASQRPAVLKAWWHFALPKTGGSKRLHYFPIKTSGWL
jgi:hypothetical protein